MSFCKNCGTNLGQANFCPSCGTAANESQNASASVNNIPSVNTNVYNGYSQYYPELKLYHSRATQVFIFGILSLVCCMGIGLIFEIISIVISSKIKKPFEHGDQLTNPMEISMYNTARSRHKIGAILSAIALLITGILLFVLIMSSMILAQIS